MSIDEIHYDTAAAEPVAPAAEEPPPTPGHFTSQTPGPAGPFAGEDWSLRAWGRLLRDLYCVFDRRTLGFSRILLGFLLLMDVIHRGAAWEDMYSTFGVLPTSLNLQRPQAWGAFSIFNGFSTPGELRVLWVIMAINAVCVMVGYRTKVAQMAALVLHAGMNGRVLLIENGGYVVNNLLLLWTLFLPLGDRFSIDALRASYRRRREVTAADLNDRSDRWGIGTPGTGMARMADHERRRSSRTGASGAAAEAPQMAGPADDIVPGSYGMRNAGRVWRREQQFGRHESGDQRNDARPLCDNDNGNIRHDNNYTARDAERTVEVAAAGELP